MMIASRSSFGPLNRTCAVAGRTRERSTFQALPDSVYEPASLKLLAASRLVAAPLLSARMLGCPSPNGRSHAASATSTAAPTTSFPRALNTHSVTAGGSSPLPHRGPAQRGGRSPTAGERAGGHGTACGQTKQTPDGAHRGSRIPGDPAQHP